MPSGPLSSDQVPSIVSNATEKVSNVVDAVTAQLQNVGMATDGTGAIVTRQTRAADDTLVIRDSESLRIWRQGLRNITPTSNLPTVQFQLPGLSDLQNRSMSAMVSGYQKECGCTSGGFFMSATVVTLLVSYFGSGGLLSDINLTHVVSFVVITTLGALSGKLLGLVWARWRLLNLATNIYAKVVATA